MKHLLYAICIMLTGTATELQAGSLNVPNTFSAGTPAVAAEVNANFEATKNAVDDNDTRITTNADAISVNSTAIGSLDSSKQNRVNMICGTGYAIRAINADGSVVCEFDNDSGGDIESVTTGPGLTGGGYSGDITLRLRSGAISVTAAAFKPSNPGCDMLRGPSLAYYSTTSTYTYCDAYADIQLPDGATITSLSCRLYDNDALANHNVTLYRVTSSSGNASAMFETSYTSSATTYIQTETDNTAELDPLIYNAAYSYLLSWNTQLHNTTSVGQDVRIFNCTITYSY